MEQGRDKCHPPQARKISSAFRSQLDRGRTFRKILQVAREPLAALLAQAKDTRFSIWSSDAPRKNAGLYWLVAQLEPLGWENLDVSLVELPAFLEREDGVVVQYRAWGEVCPEEWSRWKTAGVRLPSPLLRAMADRWKELRRENAPLRAVLNGRLVSAPETLYDFFLFQEIAAQPEEFREEEVIGRVLGVTQSPFPMSFGPANGAVDPGWTAGSRHPAQSRGRHPTAASCEKSR